MHWVIKFLIATAIAVTVGLMVITGIGSVLNVQAQTSACVSGGAVSSQYPDLVKDCETLLGMKGTIRGSGKLNWWTGRSIAKWDGVQLSGNRVTGLDLTGFGLNGIIPPELAQLPLKKLLLSGNSFTGCVPDVLLQIEHTDVGSIGLSLCSGGNATPSPTPSSVTPEPTTTPTPVEVACEQLSFASIEAFLSLLPMSEDPDEHFGLYSETRTSMQNRFAYMVSVLENKPAMKRMAERLWIHSPEYSSLDVTFWELQILARQLARLCWHEGYSEALMQVDDIAETICGGSTLAYDKEITTLLPSISQRCRKRPDHTHDLFDDRTHSHLELHSHSGY